MDRRRLDAARVAVLDEFSPEGSGNGRAGVVANERDDGVQGELAIVHALGEDDVIVAVRRLGADPGKRLAGFSSVGALRKTVLRYSNSLLLGNALSNVSRLQACFSESGKPRGPYELRKVVMSAVPRLYKWVTRATIKRGKVVVGEECRQPIHWEIHSCKGN
jgi:hypothetical protein